MVLHPSHRPPRNLGLVPPPPLDHEHIPPVLLLEIKTANTNCGEDSTAQTRSGPHYTPNGQRSTNGEGSRRVGDARRCGISR